MDQEGQSQESVEVMNLTGLEICDCAGELDRVHVHGCIVPETMLAPSLNMESLTLQWGKSERQTPGIFEVTVETTGRSSVSPIEYSELENTQNTKSIDNKQSILAYNGGAIIAMKGKDCVAIASDTRFGIQAQTISTNFEKIFEMGPHLYCGLPGLTTDTYTVLNKLKFRLNMYELKEDRRVNPKVFLSMVSNLLYERRFGPFFVEPVIAGLDPKTGKPFIANLDLIGCPNEPEDFVVGGTCSDQLYGMCESLWEPNLGPEDLFETISQALVNAFDRDALSGWGASVYIIEKDKVTHKRVKTRMD